MSGNDSSEDSPATGEPPADAGQAGDGEVATDAREATGGTGPAGMDDDHSGGPAGVATDDHPGGPGPGATVVDPGSRAGVANRPDRPFGLPRWVAAVVPLALLAVVLVVFVATAPLAGIETGEPAPEVTVTNTELPDGETMVLHVTNDGPEPVTISQVLVDEAYWSFEVRGTEGRTLDSHESARVVVPYHWTEDWDFDVGLVLAGGETVEHGIEAAHETPGMNLDLLWTLALIGLFVGVIPVALGMLWYPYIRAMSDRWLHAVLAFSAGVLAFLAADATFEAFEIAEGAPGFLEGNLLVVLGIAGALLLVEAVGAWQGADDPDGRGDGLRIAYLVALGIGLHNLGEGLAIGSSFAQGRAALGTFLVVGFMLHNVTEGPAVVAPLARDRHPPLWHFGALGLLAGVPVVFGGWIGGLAYSPTLGALFLALGVGAILQVTWEIAGMIRDGSGRAASATNLLAFGAGLVVMYATDVFVAV